jgi:hypothetical protein
MFAAATTNLPPTLILNIGSRLRSPSSHSPSDLGAIDGDACVLSPSSSPRQIQPVEAFASISSVNSSEGFFQL